MCAGFIKNGCLIVALLCGMVLSGLYAEQALLSDRELLTIYNREERLFERIEREGLTPQVEREAQQVVSAYRNFLMRFPESMDGLLLYGKFLRRSGNPKEAMQVFLEARKRDPKLAVVQQELGNCLAEEGEYKAAMICFLNAIELEPKQPLYHFQLGVLLAEFKQELAEHEEWSLAELEQQAVNAFASAHELAPESTDVLYGWGNALESMQIPDWQDALRVWDLLAKQVDGDAGVSLVQLRRARALIELKEYARVEEALGRVTSSSLQQNKQELQAKLREGTVEVK